eukprot:707462-Pelagomonas_calceolata.AAC.1
MGNVYVHRATARPCFAQGPAFATKSVYAITTIIKVRLQEEAKGYGHVPEIAKFSASGMKWCSCKQVRSGMHAHCQCDGMKPSPFLSWASDLLTNKLIKGHK